MPTRSAALPAALAVPARLATTSSVSPRSNRRCALRLAALALTLAAPAYGAQPAPTAVPQAASFIGTAINVVDLDREIRFYTEALELKVAATLPLGTRTETILNFPGDPSQAALLLMHDTSPAAPKAINHGNGFSRLVIRVTDIAAMAVRLTELGYPHGEVRSGGHGYVVMMMSDPEGFRREVVQPGAAANGS